jgi:hypothetical protein
MAHSSFESDSPPEGVSGFFGEGFGDGRADAGVKTVTPPL